MFKKTILLISILLLLTACTSAAKTDLTLATTTSVNDSGLLEYLRPELEKDINVNLNVISQGTGQAIKTAEAGDADVVLVHSKSAEEEFVSGGFGASRIPFMYNYFVVVGPKDDPAGIKGFATASEGFAKIANAKATFISRGDDSGTHTKEKNLWKSAGIEPAGDFYISAGRGMGDTLTMASEMLGYTLTDKATYLSMQDKLDLEILIEESADLKNEYSVIEVNAANVKVKNNEGAKNFVKWITSKKALDLIAKYGIDTYGEALFFVYE